MVTYPFAQGGPLLAVLLIATVVGGRVEELLIRFGITVVILGAAGGVHYARFRYRLIDGRLETTAGLIARKSKVINVDRIRGVDVEAKLAHRIAGVCALRIEHPGAAGGSRGRNRDGRDRIDAISRAEGERLRNVLLHERAIVVAAQSIGRAYAYGSAAVTGPQNGLPSPAAVARAAPDRVLLRMPQRWLLYAPFSLRLLVLGPAALLGVFNSLRDASVNSGHLAGLTLSASRPVLVVLVVLVLVVTAMASGAVTYWHWTVRTRGDDIVLTRGLLTRRTVAIERRRLRGVIVREPLAGRPFRAATLQVVLSGVTGNVRSALVPLGPRPALDAFGREFVAPCRAPIVVHPRGALRRRLRRGLAPCATGIMAAVVAAPFDPAVALVIGGIAVVAAPLGLLWGRASYAALGHALDDRVLFARHGVLVRHTETVERSEPIGLRIRQSVFARRNGVASVDVALVARGFSRISDMAATDVQTFATTLLGRY